MTMNLWDRMKYKILGGVVWTCPKCKEQFYGNWGNIEPQILEHVIFRHQFSWDSNKGMGNNLTKFLKQKGRIRKK